jgi:hypothetical protein
MRTFTRFGPMSGTLRIVKDHADLEALRMAGIGFVINLRPELAMIHRVRCEALEVMSTSEHYKVYCVTAREAIGWLANDPTADRKHCGKCGGGQYDSSAKSHT